MRLHLSCVLALLALPAAAAERKFDLSAVQEGQLPPGFRSAVTGQGRPGDWRVVLDEVPSLMPAVMPGAQSVARKAVLAQVAQDPTDEHFPLLINEAEIMGNFTLTTRLKTVRGVVEQMAGIAFRVQNESNYYVVRVSSLGNNVRFYKVLQGIRGPLVGPELPVPAGVWHDLTIEAKGNSFRCLLNGKEVITATDSVNPFMSGKVAFWTKSDAVSYFADTRLVYTPHEPPAQTLVRDTLKKYPRLLGLQVWLPGAEPGTTRLAASKLPAEVGRAGGKIELDVIEKGTPYYGDEKDYVSVVLPLRDRNGDPVAAVRVKLKPSGSRDAQNAYARARPVIAEMQKQAATLQDFAQ